MADNCPERITVELSEMVPLGAKRSAAKGGNVGEGVAVRMNGKRL
jgi:hypothetical protein